MRKTVCIVLTALVLLLSGCGKPETPENPYRIKTVIHASCPDGTAIPWRFEYTYDENGWISEIREYENDTLDVTTSYRHDAYGNIVSSTAIRSDGTKATTEEKLTLDGQNRVIRSEGTFDDGQKTLTEYGYNKQGQTEKLYIYRYGALNGEDINSFVDSTYDRRGRLLRQETRWEPSNTNATTLYTYEKDRLLRTETYESGKLDSYTAYTYDKTGLVQTSIAYDADGTLRSKHITTFDEYGNQLEVVSYAYASERMRSGVTDEEPDRRTSYIYELKNPNLK